MFVLFQLHKQDHCNPRHESTTDITAAIPTTIALFSNNLKQAVQITLNSKTQLYYWVCNIAAYFSTGCTTMQEVKFLLELVHNTYSPVSYTHLTLPTIYSV